MSGPRRLGSGLRRLALSGESTTSRAREHPSHRRKHEDTVAPERGRLVQAAPLPTQPALDHAALGVELCLLHPRPLELGPVHAPCPRTTTRTPSSAQSPARVPGIGERAPCAARRGVLPAFAPPRSDKSCFASWTKSPRALPSRTSCTTWFDPRERQRDGPLRPIVRDLLKLPAEDFAGEDAALFRREDTDPHHPLHHLRQALRVARRERLRLEPPETDAEIGRARRDS